MHKTFQNNKEVNVFEKVYDHKMQYQTSSLPKNLKVHHTSTLKWVELNEPVEPYFWEM